MSKPTESKPSESSKEPEKAPSTSSEPKPTTESKPESGSSAEPEPPVESEPAQSTEVEESAAPAFDIDYWINYAKDYAVSIGLILDPEAVECWDTPMIAGSHSKYLERDIKDCLNSYKNIEGFTGVWIWAEPDGNGAYELYIGYE